MKNLVRLFMFLSLVFIGSISFIVYADSVEGEELVLNGDFDFQAGELAFPDPVFGAEYGNAEGWGSLAFDSAALVISDPDNPENTVLKLSLYDEGQNWSSFFRFLTINQNTIYDLSIDFKIVGTTDNIGIRFAGAPALELVFLEHASKTPISGKDGWYNVKFQFDTSTGNYDSIALWFNTLGSKDNYALLDNISVKEVDSDIELNVGGDFEGFLDYAPGLELSDTVNSYGFFGNQASVGGGNGVINSNGYIGYEILLPSAEYKSSFNFEISDLTNAQTALEYYNSNDELIASKAIITSGVLDSTNVTVDNSIYSFVSNETLTEACSYIMIKHTGDSNLVIDNLSIIKMIQIPDNPFDPELTYYEINQYLQNGDFEFFNVDTVFSEEQLEGAWGSISLDGPAVVSTVDDTKVMDLTKSVGKMYTSSFVITPPELMVNDLLRFKFDYKLSLDSNLEDINVINASFVGASNEDYYTIDLKNLVNDNLTVGNEILKMPIKVTDNGNGWYTVEMDFQVTTEFLIKCNSIRWLFTPLSEDDHLYIDNVKLFVLDDEEPSNLATSLQINEEDQEIIAGDEFNLTVSVLPENAENNSVIWSSSNSDIATVDENGKVTAISKGAVEISASLQDNSLTDTIIVTVLEPESSFGLGWIIVSVVGGIIIIIGTIVLIKRR